jgi:transposase
MDANNKAWIGIDVSKDRLDVCLLRAVGRPQHKPFANAATGWAKMLRWLDHLAPGADRHFALESTGSYSTQVASFLVEAGQRVSVLNPARIKYAALAGGSGNKTDKADAFVIADYCRKEDPPLWRQALPEVQVLVALVRHRDALLEQLVQTKNRLAQPLLARPVQRSLQKVARFLEAEIARVEQQIKSHIDNTPSLREDNARLQSIPGIGEIAAQQILAELPDVNQFASAQSAAAYAGLAPQEYQSGTSVKKRTRLSKRGNARLRCALYLPALSAIRFNPSIKAFYERLLENGKCKMAALGAAMRKLLMIAYGVLKNRQTFRFEAAFEAAENAA